MGASSHLSDVWFRVTDLDVASGRGSVITTTDGAEYLDFTCGIAVTNTGHCHPKVVEAISRQAQRFIHSQVNVYRHDLLEPLAQRLAQITPDGIERFFLSNSGAEAVEGAVKLARWATGRPNVVVFEGSFHGRTAQTMAMTTSKVSYRAGHQPLPAGVFVAPYPYPLRSGEQPEMASARCLNALEQLLHTQTADSETAAFVIEPVLGEGGYVPAPTSFLEGLRHLCDRTGILLVADEIQTGFGRTGRMFDLEYHGVRPDILVMAKGMGSGFPISAIGASDELMARWPPGAHGGTYGGNPLGCAAALATIEILTAEGFLAAVQTKGGRLTAGLEKLAADHPGIAEVRGPGLMVGVELMRGGTPDGARAIAVIRHCRDESHVLFMGAGTDGNVVRWMPPLTVSEDEIDRALEAFAGALGETS